MRHSLEKYQDELHKINNPTLQDLLHDLVETQISLKRARQEKQEIEEAIIENGMCPVCMNTITTKIWQEDRGEHFGFPARETMTKKICSICEWEEE